MMNKHMGRFLKTGVLILIGTFAIGLGACGNPKLKVNYSVDGKPVDELPSQGFYEIVSIKTNNKNANATWDCNTWSLTTDTLTKNTTVNLDFAYTTHPFTVNGMGYDTLQDAFNAAGDSHAEIYLTKDATGAGSTAVGSDITFYLNGFTLDGTGSDTIVNNGKMEIIGAGTITNTVSMGANSKTLVNFGTLTVTDVILDNQTDAFTLWNSNNGQSVLNMTNCTLSRTGGEIITVINSGEMTVTGCTITGSGDLTHPTFLQNDAKAVLNISGSTVSNSGSGYDLYRESGIVNMGDAVNTSNPYGIDAAGAAPAAEPETAEPVPEDTI